MTSQKQTGGSAFPLPLGSSTTAGAEGMTLRDYFANAALTAYFADGTNSAKAVAAKWAYEMADAMLEARK